MQIGQEKKDSRPVVGGPHVVKRRSRGEAAQTRFWNAGPKRDKHVETGRRGSEERGALCPKMRQKSEVLEPGSLPSDAKSRVDGIESGEGGGFRG